MYPQNKKPIQLLNCRSRFGNELIVPRESMDNQNFLTLYKLAKAEIKYHKGKLPMRHQVFIEWSGNCESTYMDMLKAIAYNFIPERKRPHYLFALVNQTCGGKSTYLDLVSLLLGENNVQVTDSLYYTMNSITRMVRKGEFERIFGQPLAMMFDNDYSTPVGNARAQHTLRDMIYRKNFDATIYVAMARLPQYDNTYARELSEATIVLPFRADFPFNSPETYKLPEKLSADILMSIMADVLAIAWYYSAEDRQLTFSKDAEKAKEVIGTQAGNFEDYLEQFTRYFSAYQNKYMVKDDYIAWCQDKGIVAVDADKIWKRLGKVAGKYTTRQLCVKGKGRRRGNPKARVIRWGQRDNRHIFHEDEYIPELHATVGKLLYAKRNKGKALNHSVVWLLESQVSNVAFRRTSIPMNH